MSAIWGNPENIYSLRVLLPVTQAGHSILADRRFLSREIGGWRAPADHRAGRNSVVYLDRARVRAALFAEAERIRAGLPAEAAPPSRPPFRAGALFIDFPRPEPDALPPPVIAFTVAQARRSASFSSTPLFS